MSTPQPGDTEWLAAARLVRRAGFGATGSQIDEVVASGRSAYLREALSSDPANDAGAASTPAPQFEAHPPLGRNATADAKHARQVAIRTDLAQLTAWWLRRMVVAEQPLTEKVTFLWHNHFATAATKVRNAALMLGQNQTLRAEGRGNFRTLALAMLTDPAMLFWLDGQKNVAGAPNENLSREFLELFTMGHGGGYTEPDVRDGARALTGWVLNKDGSSSKNPSRHDAAPKTVLGVTGDLDEVGFLDAILAQPATAEHVVSRTYGQLGSGEPLPDASLKAVAGTFGTSWDIAGMLTAMMLGEDFTAAQGQIVVGPVEWLVGAIRAMHVPIDDDKVVRKVQSALQALGQVPFYPPSVGGWPSGSAWLSTAAADVRFSIAAALVAQADLDVISRTDQRGRVDAAGYAIGVGAWSDRSRAVLQDAAADPKRLMTAAINTSEYLTN